MKSWATRGHTFADYHHERCDESECGKAYCRKHHRLYWLCQDAEYDPSTAFFGGNGDCILCVRESQVIRERLVEAEKRRAS